MPNSDRPDRQQTQIPKKDSKGCLLFHLSIFCASQKCQSLCGIMVLILCFFITNLRSCAIHITEKNACDFVWLITPHKRCRLAQDTREFLWIDHEKQKNAKMHPVVWKRLEESEQNMQVRKTARRYKNSRQTDGVIVAEAVMRVLLWEKTPKNSEMFFLSNTKASQPTLVLSAKLPCSTELHPFGET